MIIKRKEPIETVVVTKENQELWRRCELLEYKVFLEEDYISENSEKRLLEYDKYDHFLIAAFLGNPKNNYENRKLVGVLRVGDAKQAIEADTGLFSTLDAQDRIEFYPDMLKTMLDVHPQSVLDLAAMAILKENRCSRISRALIAGFITCALEMIFSRRRDQLQAPQLRYILAAADERVYDRFIGRSFPMLGKLPIAGLGKPTMYWGSVTVPIMLDADAAISPKLHRVLYMLNNCILGFYRRGIL